MDPLFKLHLNECMSIHTSVDQLEYFVTQFDVPLYYLLKILHDIGFKHNRSISASRERITYVKCQSYLIKHIEKYKESHRQIVERKDSIEMSNYTDKQLNPYVGGGVSPISAYNGHVLDFNVYCLFLINKDISQWIHKIHKMFHTNKMIKCIVKNIHYDTITNDTFTSDFGRQIKTEIATIVKAKLIYTLPGDLIGDIVKYY